MLAVGGSYGQGLAETTGVKYRCHERRIGQKNKIQKKGEPPMPRKGANKIKKLLESGRLYRMADKYIECCRTSPREDGAKTKRQYRFPNLAGFCRYVKSGLSDLLELKVSNPDEYDRLVAIFEDEALNADISPNLLSTYMKKRLLYVCDEEAPPGAEVKYCFEHDIYADGE